jgi:poly-gamma-glutamate capsule biosynthesis protein CapA/YwtB (metallophosphatase superfamily)
VSGGAAPRRDGVTLALCGDVMTGRGIDQILPHPGDPKLYESYVSAATTYVALAERANGPIPRSVDFGYVWGDALDVLDRARPDARIINLETSITRRGRPWPKGINYRMTPENAPCLAAARIDCCALANNHVLDWGRPGLLDTLAVLRQTGIHAAGAGQTLAEAAAPAIIGLPGAGRVKVFAFASESSGVPLAWAATPERPGVNLLPDLRPRTAARLAQGARDGRQEGDLLIASIHWGGNWGYAIPAEFREFAHALLDGGFALVHGHSSHHPQGFEVHRGRLILYGCGDFLNDYEGIGGFAEYRPDLVLLYLPTLAPADGELRRLVLAPFRIRRFRLHAASVEEAGWLQARLGRETAHAGIRLVLGSDGLLRAEWG